MRRANGLRDYVSATADDSVPLARERVPYAAFSVRVSLAGIEPVGFRTKSDLRNHQAIIQPRRMVRHGSSLMSRAFAHGSLLSSDKRDRNRSRLRW